MIAATRQMITLRASFVQGEGRLIAEAGAQQILMPIPTAAGVAQAPS